MSMAMDLAASSDMWRWNGTNGCHLAGFSEDVTFACHFVAPHLPPTLPPYKSASGVGYTTKKLSKMVGNSASYWVYSRHSEFI